MRMEFELHVNSRLWKSTIHFGKLNASNTSNVIAISIRAFNCEYRIKYLQNTEEKKTYSQYQFMDIPLFGIYWSLTDILSKNKTKNNSKPSSIDVKLMPT